VLVERPGDRPNLLDWDVLDSQFAVGHRRVVGEQVGDCWRERPLDSEQALAAVLVDERVRRVDRHQLAASEQANAVGEMLGLFHVVCREQDCRARVGERFEQVPQRPASGGVDARRRFVEHEQVGVVDQRRGDTDPALLAAREVLVVGVCAVCDADLCEQFVGRACVFVQPTIEIDEFACRQPVRWRELLRQESETLAVEFAGWLPEQFDAPVAVGGAGQRAHECRLASAVRPDESEQFALAHRQRDAVECDRLAVLPADPLGDDGVHDCRLARRAKERSIAETGRHNHDS